MEEVTPLRIKALLIEQAENARISRRLATIQLDSPVTFDAATYHMRPPHQDQLTDLLRELEFTTLLKSFQTSFTHAEANAVETELVQDEPSAQRFVEGLPMGGALGLQCLLSPGPGVPGDVKGMALSTGDKTAFIPLDVRTYMRPITALLHDPTRTKVVHDLKAALLGFHRIGLTLTGPYLDSMVADYLLNPNCRDHQL